MMQSRKVPTTLEKPGARKAKTACFKLINGVAIEQGAPIPRPPRQLLSKTAQRPAFGRTAIGAPSDDGPRAKWVTMCNQVLKFQAFFKEAVNESNMENYRTRMVNIMFYLSDQQLEITEVKTENSGIPQGQFLKKGKHNMAETDLIVGSTITLYGRTYYIVNCDNFTRQYCSEKGSSQPENQPTPTDAYNTSRSLMKERDTGADQTIARGKKQNPLKKFMEASLGNASPRMRVGTQSDNLSRFLENDRQVLRFYAQWDDTSTLYGQVHNYTINFFLANGQMEVLEINKPNEGRDHFPVFLQRSKVQRARSTTIDGAGVNGVEDEDDHASIFLTTDDLIVGDYVNIYGRLLLIHDADEFTYNQLQSMTGVDHRVNRIDVAPPPELVPEVPLPPYNGFGDQQDSVENCKHLVPKPPKKDFHKAMANAPNGNDMKMLRFKAHMVTTAPADQNKDRQFIVRYYLADDTIEVFEPPVRNSGILGGKFMKRTASEYKPTDLVEGSTVILSQTQFQVDGADEYTLKFLAT